MGSECKGLNLNKEKILESAFHNGIPSEIRKNVWQIIIPNKLKINEKLYKILIERAKILIANAEIERLFCKNLKVIEEDLHRTY